MKVISVSPTPRGADGFTKRYDDDLFMGPTSSWLPLALALVLLVLCFMGFLLSGTI